MTAIDEHLEKYLAQRPALDSLGRRNRKISDWIPRFWSKVDKTKTCWIWRGAYQGSYGAFGVPGRKVFRAHRISYELLVGLIGEGLTLDHLCRNPGCVNPAHLEPVSHRVNILRGNSGSAQNARKTHCKNGHRFTKDNVGLSHGRWRTCKTCIRERNRRWYYSACGQAYRSRP